MAVAGKYSGATILESLEYINHNVRITSIDRD